MESELSAPEARAQDPFFVRQCSLSGLQAKLPLRWPTPPGTPPSPKRAYRSHYQYLGWGDLLDPTAWEHLSDFDRSAELTAKPRPASDRLHRPPPRPGPTPRLDICPGLVSF